MISRNSWWHLMWHSYFQLVKLQHLLMEQYDFSLGGDSFSLWQQTRATYETREAQIFDKGSYFDAWRCLGSAGKANRWMAAICAPKKQHVVHHGNQRGEQNENENPQLTIDDGFSKDQLKVFTQLIFKICIIILQWRLSKHSMLLSFDKT